MPGFFGRDLFEFLSDLEANNDRGWFKANKDRYEGSLKEPFLDFITAAAPHLRRLNPNIVADPRPQGGSLFRIHRDVRFSKDKSPYKTHAGAHFPVGGKDVHGPGYYLHLEPGGCFVAAGMWMPDGDSLRRVREAIASRPSQWRKARKILDEDPSRLKRHPRGFDPEHPLIEDLKRRSFTGSVGLTQAQVTGPRFMDGFATGCRDLTPLVAFLAVSVGAPW